jgi:hypothetical protein
MPRMRLGGFVMKLRKFAVVLGFVVASAMVSGCATHLTPQDVEAYGTRDFATSKEELVKDVAVVLEGMGYEVVLADAEKGLVKTGRKQIGQVTSTSGISSNRETSKGKYGTTSSGSSSSTSYSTSYYRQYVVKVEDSGHGKLKVRVTPKVFIGERDVSNEEVWKLEGAGGEIELWASFFSELESLN